MTKKAAVMLEKTALSPELLDRAARKATDAASKYRNLAGPFLRHPILFNQEMHNNITKARKKINQAELFSRGSIDAAHKEFDDLASGIKDTSRLVEDMLSNIHKRNKRDRTIIGIGAGVGAAGLTAAAYESKKKKLEKIAGAQAEIYKKVKPLMDKWNQVQKPAEILELARIAPLRAKARALGLFPEPKNMLRKMDNNQAGRSIRAYKNVMDMLK
jgi:hypothetical protein